MNSERAGGRVAAAAITSPGPGWGLKAAPGPGGALGGRRVIIQYGRGVSSSPSKSCRISFFHHHFCAINIFPFPFWIQNLVRVGLELTLAMSQYMDIDPGVLALL